MHGAVGGLAFGRRHSPSLGGGLDEHGACGRAEPVKIRVVIRRRAAATGTLVAVRGVEIALDNDNVFPIHVQFLRNDHWKGRLDALADFGLFRDQCDHAVRGYANESVWFKLGACGGFDDVGKCGTRRLKVETQNEAAPGEDGEF